MTESFDDFLFGALSHGFLLKLIQIFCDKLSELIIEAVAANKCCCRLLPSNYYNTISYSVLGSERSILTLVANVKAVTLEKIFLDVVIV